MSAYCLPPVTPLHPVRLTLSYCDRSLRERAGEGMRSDPFLLVPLFRGMVGGCRHHVSRSRHRFGRRESLKDSNIKRCETLTQHYF